MYASHGNREAFPAPFWPRPGFSSSCPVRSWCIPVGFPESTLTYRSYCLMLITRQNLIKFSQCMDNGEHPGCPCTKTEVRPGCMATHKKEKLADMIFVLFHFKTMLYPIHNYLMLLFLCVFL